MTGGHEDRAAAAGGFVGLPAVPEEPGPDRKEPPMAEPTTPFSLTETAVTVHTAALPGEDTVLVFIEAKVSSVRDPAAPTSWRSRLKGGLRTRVRPQHLGEGSAPREGRGVPMSTPIRSSTSGEVPVPGSHQLGSVRPVDGRHDLEVAFKVSDAAAKLALDHFRNGLATTPKADGTPVTEADRAVERLLQGMISSARPEDAPHVSPASEMGPP